MKKIAPILTIALAVVSFAASAAIPAESWEIGPNVRGMNYSQGMPLRPTPGPNGSAWFDFPQAGGEVDAMTTPIDPLMGARSITLRYRVEAGRGVRFIPSEANSEQATVSLYFQRRGDNWTGKGRFASFRWYAPSAAVVPVAPGVHTVTIALSDVWTNVVGQPNTDHADAYASALSDTAILGIAFGSAGMRSHGLYATGQSRFTLLALDIQ